MPIVEAGLPLSGDEASRRAISNITATPLAPSLAAITGLRWLAESGSLSAHGRLSQWAQSKMRVVAFGL